MIRLPVTALALLLTSAPAQARDPQFAQPIACTLGEDCFVLQYVDSDPGPGAADFTCGPMSYDGHKGTDFALPSFAAMNAGVAVTAVAPGVVRATRDGMPDLGADDTPAGVLEGRECGNGVVIDHGGGWETQYCHLKLGSLSVIDGQRVTMGARLGDVGYSGRTQFPHLHIVVRKDGVVVDPFNADGITQCGAQDIGDQLFSPQIARAPGGIAALSASDAVPDYTAVKAGDATRTTLAPDAPALVAWAFGFGAEPGDVMEIVILSPEGAPVSHTRQVFDARQVLYFRAAGKKRTTEAWPTGVYAISARLLRGETVIDQRDSAVEIAQ